MKNVAEKIKNPVFISILLIIIISSIAYLSLISKFGYYSDDWHTIWAGKTIGYEKIAEEESIDRPFLGFLHSLEFLILGDAPLTWQIWIFILRIIGGLLLYWILTIIFPEQKLATLLMVLLYSIYPGFSEMPIASIYQLMFLGINFGLISLLFTLKAIISKKKLIKIVFVIISGVFALLNVGMVEWFIGIEGVRLTLILYLLSKDQKNRKIIQNIPLALGYWSPVLFSMIIFLYWRIFIFVSLRNTTDFNAVINTYISHPLLTIGHFVLDTISGFFQATIVAWVGPLWQRLSSSGYYEGFIGLLFGLFAILCSMILFWLWKKVFSKTANENNPKKTDDRWQISGIIIGVISTFVTLIPATFNDRRVYLTSSLSRYTLNSIMGISILIISLLFWMIKNKSIIIGLVILIIGGAVTTHYLNSLSFAEMSAKQNNFWWQLSWRAPDIKNDTVLIPLLNTYSFRDIYEIFPQVNFIYRPGVKSVEIAGQVLNLDIARQIITGSAPTHRNFRTIEMYLDYSNSLVVTYGSDSFPNACVHVIDGKHKELTPNEDPIIQTISDISNINDVVPDSMSKLPPIIYFGDEPLHNWCYFFQKASLALQQTNWMEISVLASEVENKRLHPSDLSEWMPFFYADINLNKFDDAKEIAILIQSDPVTKSLICKQLTLMGKDNNYYLSSDKYNEAIDILCNS